MAQLRMNRARLPEEALEMVTDVIEIGCKHDPATKKAWRDGHERSALRLPSLFGHIDDE